MSADDARLAVFERRLAEVEARAKKALDESAAAKRDAARSISEGQGIAEGLKMHLASIEARRASAEAEARADRDKAEVVRRSAAAAHAKRFEEQGETLHKVVEYMRLAAYRDEQAEKAEARAKAHRNWMLGAIIAIITTLANLAANFYAKSEVPPVTVAAPAAHAPVHLEVPR